MQIIFFAAIQAAERDPNGKAHWIADTSLSESCHSHLLSEINSDTERI